MPADHDVVCHRLVGRLYQIWRRGGWYRTKRGMRRKLFTPQQYQQLAMTIYTEFYEVEP